ncbi:serine protease inhibitor I/II-like [Schistocerca piceifrons]|uniref:serine protease inhibitor I/II-like n=1 Tax=Schistocerca piceifrons TaxID=274613 RepID=UPI001F5F931F|nr:serine protease inhibitor I/II-like [Schistocerca piceifrons]
MKIAAALATTLLLVSIATRALADGECNPGDTKKDDCNSCICAKGGVWACTQMACPKVQEACTPGERKKIDCNWCTCVKEAGWACTKIACPTVKEVQMKCEPGTTFKEDCNICVCGSDGITAACTLKECSGRRRREFEDNDTVHVNEQLVDIEMTKFFQRPIITKS